MTNDFFNPKPIFKKSSIEGQLARDIYKYKKTKATFKRKIRPELNHLNILIPISDTLKYDLFSL